MDAFVRPALGVDRPAVERLLRLSMEHEGETPITPAAFDRTWQNASQPGGAFRFMVADIVGAGVVGLMSVHTHFSTYAGKTILRLEDVIVSPEHRGKGIGRALMQFANDYAAQINAHRIELTVGAENKAARKLYQAAGFIHTKYVRYDKTPRRAP